MVVMHEGFTRRLFLLEVYKLSISPHSALNKGNLLQELGMAECLFCEVGIRIFFIVSNALSF